VPAIQVTHRDQARIRGYGAAAGVAALGFLVALILLITWAVRAARDRREARYGGSAPGDAPYPYP
jgi:hypothetical protein